MAGLAGCWLQLTDSAFFQVAEFGVGVTLLGVTRILAVLNPGEADLNASADNGFTVDLFFAVEAVGAVAVLGATAETLAAVLETLRGCDTVVGVRSALVIAGTRSTGSTLASTLATVSFGVTAAQLRIGTVCVFFADRLFLTPIDFFVANGLVGGAVSVVGTFYFLTGRGGHVTDGAEFLAMLILGTGYALTSFCVAAGLGSIVGTVTVSFARGNSTATAVAGDAGAGAIQRRVAGLSTGLTHTASSSANTLLTVGAIIGLGAFVCAFVDTAVVLTDLGVGAVTGFLAFGACAGGAFVFTTTFFAGLVVATVVVALAFAAGAGLGTLAGLLASS